MGSDLSISTGEVIRSELAHAMLINQETGEIQEFMINPSELRASLQVKWNTPSPIMRAPAGPLNYASTSPKEYQVRAWVDAELFPDRDIMDWMAFLESMCYPIQTGDVIADPPTVLFVWPGILAMSCKVVSLQHRFDEFRTDLHPKSYATDIVLQEYGDLIRWSGDERERMVITEGIG